MEKKVLTIGAKTMRTNFEDRRDRQKLKFQRCQRLYRPAKPINSTTAVNSIIGL